MSNHVRERNPENAVSSQIYLNPRDQGLELWPAIGHWLSSNHMLPSAHNQCPRLQPAFGICLSFTEPSIRLCTKQTSLIPALDQQAHPSEFLRRKWVLDLCLSRIIEYTVYNFSFLQDGNKLLLLYFIHQQPSSCLIDWRPEGWCHPPVLVRLWPVAPLHLVDLAWQRQKAVFHQWSLWLLLLLSDWTDSSAGKRENNHVKPCLTMTNDTAQSSTLDINIMYEDVIFGYIARGAKATPITATPTHSASGAAELQFLCLFCFFYKVIHIAVKKYLSPF